MSFLIFHSERNSLNEPYDTIRSILPPDLKKKKLFILTSGYEISELIPFADNRKRFEIHCERPIVSPIKCHYLPTKGLLNRHIALWQSHGYYFEQSLNRWEWQRARIFETVEDLYTQSFVMPFLTPMLQNAGAYVFSPRERDTNRHELIADNDNADTYFETGTEKVKWENGGTGFAHTVSVYTGTRNPFDDGSFRQTKTTTDPRKEIQAHWYAPIPPNREICSLYRLPHSQKQYRRRFIHRISQRRKNTVQSQSKYGRRHMDIFRTFRFRQR